MRYKIILSFDGSQFHGWQTQHQEQSIQEAVEKVLSSLCNQTIKVHGASRTDAGVHAEHFVAHFDATTSLTLKAIKTGFNRLISDDIFMRSIHKVDGQFSARFNRSIKTYRYQLTNGDRSPFTHRYWQYVYFSIDLVLFETSLKKFIGTHDFKNFTIKKEDQDNFIRTITSIEVKKKQHQYIVTFQGYGFMTHMVRMIMGTCLACVQGKLTLLEIDTLLKAQTHHPVSYKVPAKGLILEGVTYE
jgi:tRNA pseudouridine38-40 synthase